MFLRNAWYVAGWAENFGRHLTALTIMEEPIVIYRTEAGQAVALADECPHKRLPLSKGKLMGDALQCGYHGLTFDCQGQCIRVPGQTTFPKPLSSGAIRWKSAGAFSGSGWARPIAPTPG